MKISEYTKRPKAKDVKRDEEPGELHRGFGRPQDKAPRDVKHVDRTKYKRKPKHKDVY